MEPTKPKKRAFRACMPCRARKVRCIVTGPFQPCMNCKLDEKDCDFTRGARIPPNHPRYPLPGANTPDSHSDVSSTECPQAAAAAAAALAHSPRGADGPGGNLIDQRRSMGNQVQGQSGKESSAIADNQGLLYDPTEPAYAFLQAPKVKTILPQDLEFLYNQGCFIVPERKVLDEFIQKYFSFIQPILPILNEADFWTLYNATDSNVNSEDRISIIVLQGMLFTSCTFMSLETIQSLGFKTTQDAKYSFYRRAKLLYDFGYERSSIAIAQAAVLLSHSHLIPLPYGGYKQLGSLWAGIAIHHARDARAHRYYLMTPDGTQSPEELKRYNVLKRLWWCCIICDRVIPLTSRQNIKITKSNFNFDGTPMLTVDDFADEFEHSDVYDATTKALLAQVLIKLVELCVVLTDVLTLSALVHEIPSVGLSHKLVEMNQAGMCRIQLQRWYNNFLEMKSAISRKASQMAGDQSARNSVILFTNLAEMYYHSARLTLCHYEMLQLGQSASSLSSSLNITDMIQKSYELQNATSQVTECLAELAHLGLIRWLPMSAVGCTAFPLALQILDVELLQLKVKDTSKSTTSSIFPGYQQERLNILIDAMKTYRPRYYIADWVAQTIRHIVNVAQLYLPSKDAKPGSSGLSVASWIEILQSQPTCYLRLALTMDLSISNGKLPDEYDFPPGLQHVLHGRIKVSPEFLPFNFNTRPGTGASPRNSSSKALQYPQPTEDRSDSGTPNSSEPDGNATPKPITEDVMSHDTPSGAVDHMGDLDAAFANIPYPDILSTISFPGIDPSYVASNPGAFTQDVFDFNPDTSFALLQSQTLDVQMGNTYPTHDSSTLFDSRHWKEGQTNNQAEDLNAQMNDSILEAFRDAASSNYRSNDERLLEELEKVVGLS